MSVRVNHIVALLVVQIACVGGGLWAHYHQVVSSVDAAAVAEAWSQMESDASVLRPAIDSLDPEQVGFAAGVSDSIRLAKLTLASPHHGAIIVDQEWRVVAQPTISAGYGGSAVALGDRLEWEADADQADLPPGTLRGRLTMPDGQHLAVATSLAQRKLMLLVHAPTAKVMGQSRALLSAMPLLSLMAFIWTSMLLAISGYLILTRVQTAVDHQSKRAKSENVRQTQHLVRTRDAIIFGLAKLADSRDAETGDHLERISLYCTALASTLHRHPKYASEVTSVFVRTIGIGSALHDIGKVGIEDSILLKPGALTPEERERMQKHCTIGGDCLREIEQQLGRSNFLQMARAIAFAHHERWDGKGYPEGLAGEAIPLAARIAAIADVYDALSSKRVYKDAFPHDKCVSIIRQDAGRRFDPDLVEIFLSIESGFREIASQYAAEPSGDQVKDTRPTAASHHKDESDKREPALATSDTVE